MTIDEMQAEVDRKGKCEQLRQIFESLEQRVFDALGGEDKLHPYDVANIKGYITRAHLVALKPLEPNHGKKVLLPDAADSAQPAG